MLIKRVLFQKLMFNKNTEWGITCGEYCVDSPGLMWAILDTVMINWSCWSEIV